MAPLIHLRALAVSLVLVSATVLAQTAPPAAPPAAPASQTAPAQPPAAPAASPNPAVSGGTIHGTVKDGNIPLPGVSVTASNSLTGKKYSTTTDITGSYTLVIPQDGRYVVKTDFAAFAAVTQEALLNATAHDLKVDFNLMLASRAQQQEQQTDLAGAARQFINGGGAQSLSLTGEASDLIQAGGGGAESGAQLPSLAGNSDFSSGESVAVNGQMGTTNPFAGIDFSQMRENAELNQSLNGNQAGQGGQGGPGGVEVAEVAAALAVAADFAAEAVDAAVAAWASAAISATSNPTSPTAPSSGPEAMAPSTLRTSPCAASPFRSPRTPRTASA